MGGWNGHAGEKADGFEYDTHNFKGERIQKLAMAKKFFCRHLFQEESHFVTLVVPCPRLTLFFVEKLLKVW